MVEDQGADAGFRIHHHAFGEMHADFFGPQEHPDAGLVVEAGASWIAAAVTLPAVARSKTLGHGQSGRTGETRVSAKAAMQPFGTGFGAFDCERLHTV